MTSPDLTSLRMCSFIGRFIFVCEIEILGDTGWCHLTKVKNVRYWAPRENGLADLAANGPNDDDEIDIWADQLFRLDKLISVGDVNLSAWHAK